MFIGTELAELFLSVCVVVQASPFFMHIAGRTACAFSAHERASISTAVIC